MIAMSAKVVHYRRGSLEKARVRSEGGYPRFVRCERATQVRNVRCQCHMCTTLVQHSLQLWPEVRVGVLGM